MTDTQWPTFMVFEQEAEGKPHQHAGTVHAPDLEMALLNARDVFVRRPQVRSLWVVRAEAITSKTAQGLANSAWMQDIAPADTPPEPYYVFAKVDQKGQCIHMGEVEAASASLAIKVAIEKYARPDALMWWVFPARAVRRSTPEDIEPMFEPAAQKHFRHQTQFANLMLLRRMTDDWRKRQESG